MSIAERYKIIEKLGNQARRKFGETYLVENKESGKNGVLKAVRKESVKEHIQERLRHEAEFHFNFAGLPEILEFHESETELLLIRSFVSGVQIDHYWKSLKRKKRISFLVPFFEKLDVIFNHLQTQQVVHCDIKPSNILIEEQGDDFCIHLIDFGLALNLQKEEERTTLFPLGYAAPEILLNQLDIADQRSDIFALGVLIWRLYADKLPLVHPNPSIFTNLQLTHPLPEHDAISKKLFSILARMSHKHQFQMPPNKMDISEVRQQLSSAMDVRYASLTEVLEDLRKLEKKRLFI